MHSMNIGGNCSFKQDSGGMVMESMQVANSKVLFWLLSRGLWTPSSDHSQGSRFVQMRVAYSWME